MLLPQVGQAHPRMLRVRRKLPRTLRCGTCPERVPSPRMAEEQDWLEVTLDQASRRGLAERVEGHPHEGGSEDIQRHLLRMLRSNRDELLLDVEQARVVLDVLNVDRRLSALRARLEAFLRARAGAV